MFSSSAVSPELHSMDMSRPKQPQLPYELYGLILQFCDTPSLKMTSLVNRTFYEISQIHLFHFVLVGENVLVRDIDDTSESLTAEKLFSLIEAHPNIAGYVQSLWMDFSREYHNECWITDDTTMHELLPRLQQLNRITIHAQPMVLWDSFPSKFQNALRTAFQSSLLHTIDVRGILGFPLEIVLGSSVKHLSYTSVMLQPGGTVTSPPCPLESLALQDIYDVGLSQLQTVFVLNHLVEFHFSVRHLENIGNFVPILQVCTDSLEVLGIRVEKLQVPPAYILSRGTFRVLRYPEDVLIVDLSQLPKLRKLIFGTNLEANSYSTATKYVCRIPWIIQCLKTLPSPPLSTLSEITVNASPIITSERTDSENLYFHYPWQDLINTFSSPNLASVKKFNLNINIVTIRPYQEQFMDILRRDAYLAKLRDKKLLTIGMFNKWDF